MTQCGACARIGTNDISKLRHSPDCRKAERFYRFIYQLDGEDSYGHLEVYWKLTPKQAYAKAWNMLSNKYPNILWMEM